MQRNLNAKFQLRNQPYLPMAFLIFVSVLIALMVYSQGKGDHSETPEFNRHFLVSSAGDIYNSSERIRVLVRNISNHQIMFERDFGGIIYLLSENNDTLEPIENLINYFDSGPVVLEPSGEPQDYSIATFQPKIENRKFPLRILLILRGRLVINGVASQEYAVSELVLEIDR